MGGAISAPPPVEKPTWLGMHPSSSLPTPVTGSSMVGVGFGLGKNPPAAHAEVGLGSRPLKSIMRRFAALKAVEQLGSRTGKKTVRERGLRDYGGAA